MIQDLEAIVRKNWAAYFPGSAAPDNFRFILKRRLNRFQIFIFKDAGTMPLAVAKLPLDSCRELRENEINL